MNTTMPMRQLGKTGIVVSAIGFGCWALGGSLGEVDDETSISAVRRALELGVNFFDTADCYGKGRSETVLGRALAGDRDKAVIATKAGSDFYAPKKRKHYDAAYLRKALHHSLERLGTDYVDLFQLHDPAARAIVNDDTLAGMQALKEEGKTRAIGVSVHKLEEARAVVLSGVYDTLQISYNVVDQQVANRIAALAMEHGVGVIAREPLEQGLLSGKYSREHVFPSSDARARKSTQQRRALHDAADAMAAYFHKTHGVHRPLAAIAMQLPLSDPAVSTVIISCKTPDQVERNAAVATMPPLTAPQLAWLRE